MNNERFNQVKEFLNSFPHKEFGLHDTISAHTAIAELKHCFTLIQLFNLADDIVCSRTNWDDEIKLFNNLTYDHKRIVIWYLDNLYACEVLYLLRTKQHAENILKDI